MADANDDPTTKVRESPCCNCILH